MKQPRGRGGADDLEREGPTMLKSMWKATAISIVLVCAAGGARSEPRYSVGPHVSTLGAGAEGSMRLSDNLVLRLGGGYLGFGTSESADGVSYDIDVSLANAGGALDYHPFGNGFMISAGVYWNGNGADFNATPTSNVTIGNTTYTPAQLGRIDGELEFNPVAPYLGLGWDGTYYGDGALSFQFRVGLFYMGDPDVTLRSTGTLAGTGAFQADLAREESNIEDELEFLGFYPAITLGFTYRF
jgi:hypothetical protein